MHLSCDSRSQWCVGSHVKCALMVHLLSERDALITNSFSELDTPLLLPLSLRLVLEQGTNALRIQY